MIPATSAHPQLSTDFSAPCIGILADSPRLLNVIKYVLAENYLLISQVVGGNAYSFSPAEINAMRLVILAVARPETEPLVMLGQVGLGCLIGQAPILLITERRFHPAPTGVIVGLTYPFTPEALRNAVQALYPRP